MYLHLNNNPNNFKSPLSLAKGIKDFLQKKEKTLKKMFTFAVDNDNQVISMFFLGMECSEVTLGERVSVDDRFARNLSSILSKNQEKFLAQC